LVPLHLFLSCLPARASSAGPTRASPIFSFRWTLAIIRSARSGKVYYLRTQVYERSEQDRNVKLEPFESAEGQFLISASSFGTYHPKK